MPLLYLREVQPFLPSDPKQQMEESMMAMSKKGKGTTSTLDREKEKKITKRTTSLIISDAFVLIVEVLQVLALIQSMSLKWSYPSTWLKNANFILLFNADAWDFVKVHGGAYTRVQNRETPSSSISVEYDHILIAWGILLLSFTVIFLSVYFILSHRQPPYLMVHYARLERVFLFTCQILALPLGTVTFRLFHCTMKQMSVADTVTCFEGLAWAYLTPAVIVIILLFAVVPIWLIVRIRRQKLLMASHHHEDYLRLKEVEYMSGLDVVWAVQGYHLFSSFHLRAVFFKPFVHFVKLILLIIFASADYNILNQAVSLSVILSLLAILVIIVRPYRVTSFNVILSLSLGCLAGNAIFGAMIAAVTPATVESPWLVEPYSYGILSAINAILVLSILTWIIFMISRILCCKKCYPNEPLWPVLTSYKYRVDGMETYKFMAAVLRGRAVLDSCIRATMIFAPVHQLARQIEIINAYCREAEKTKDSLHATMLQLLDDMIEVHRRLEPVSLFADTVKEEIRRNAARFVELMPAFCHRLAQRDYDLILVHPLKKRLLLKMSIVGMFLNAKRQEPVKDPVTQTALVKIWDEVPEIVEFQEKADYREDLYPEPPVGPDLETIYMADTINRPLELMELDDSDEEESLAMFLQRVPPVLTLKYEDSRPGSQASLIVEDLVGPTDEERQAPPPKNDSHISKMPEVETISAPNMSISAEVHAENAHNENDTHIENDQLLQSSEVSESNTAAGFVNEGFVNTEDESVREDNEHIQNDDQKSEEAESLESHALKSEGGDNKNVGSIAGLPVDETSTD